MVPDKEVYRVYRPSLRRNVAIAKCQRTHYPFDKSIYNRVTHLLRNELQTLRQQRFQDYTLPLSTEGKFFWTATHRILTYKSVTSFLPRDDGSWASSGEEKADLFASYLLSVFTPRPDLKDHDSNTIIEEDLNLLYHSPLINSISDFGESMLTKLNKNT